MKISEDGNIAIKQAQNEAPTKSNLVGADNGPTNDNTEAPITEQEAENNTEKIEACAWEMMKILTLLLINLVTTGAFFHKSEW